MRETADISAGPRHAVIDIGSNTVRLVIYGGAPRAPTVIWNEKVTAKLGRDLATTGRMSEEAMDLALAGLRRYRLLLDQLGVADVAVLATAAVRDAENGADFAEQVIETGFTPHVLSGEEEAMLAAYGVAGAFPTATGLVADLGGGSLELVQIAEGTPGAGYSARVGTLRMAAMREAEGKLPRVKLDKILKKLNVDTGHGGALYLVGGTFRAFAAYTLAQTKSPVEDPHGLTLTRDDAARIAKKLARSRPDKIAQTPGISSMRAAKLPDAAALLATMIKRFAPHCIVISAWGLREGYLYSRLEQLQQLQDPLLAGINAFASPRGGTASLAARIAGWSVAGRPEVSRGTERLRLAAAQLALASMSIEPNLRLRQSINLALHKRWIGVDYEDRAILAAALAANAGSTLPDNIASLASAEAIEEGTAWGLGMRLYRRLGGNSGSTLEATSLRRENGTLALSFAESAAALCNGGVEKDLARLAEALHLEPRIEFLTDRELSQIRTGDAA